MPQPARRPAGAEVACLKHALLATLLLTLAAPGTASAGDEEDLDFMRPLLQFARERERTRDERPRPTPAGVSELKEARHQLEQSNPPREGECAGSLGAAVYADLYAELAAAHAAEGDYGGAAVELRKAHDCRPHSADILSQLAGVLFDARDFAGAREANNAALVLDPRSVNGNRTAGNLDYIEQRWADAIARFRYVAASDDDRTRAGYGQLMFWLAQRRAGVAKPEFVQRIPPEGWPQPLLLYMKGEYTEAELVGPIMRGDRDSNSQPQTSTDERLCEALFYVGEEYWARGEPEVARDYFAALVNLRVLYFLEHGLALAEIARLR